jgi:tetratricopeptide (TPR) repeat protein
MERRGYFTVLLIIVIGLVAYANSFGNKFVYDDFTHIVHNPAIKSLNNTASFFTDYTTSTTSREMSGKLYRPLFVLSFALDYATWKLNPTYYHLENFLFHILNAILVFAIMRLMIGGYAGATFISLLFVTHPVHTEVVNWISHRSDLMGLFFYLSAFYMHCRISSFNKGRVAAYCLMIFFFAASLLCKESMITLPVVIFLSDIILFWDKSKTNLRRYLWYYLPFLVVIVCYLLLRMNILDQAFNAGKRSYSPSITMTLSAFVKYVLLMLFPANLSLAHATRTISIVASVGMLGCILLATLFLRKYSKIFTFGMCWFFVTLAPVLAFSAYDYVSDRHLYLPSVGFFAAAVGLIIKQQDWLRKTFYYFLCFIIAVYTGLTINRNPDWKDNLSLFKSTVRTSPQNPRMSYWLGKSYYDKGMKKEAIEELKRTIKIDNRHSYKPYIALGDIYYKEREYDKAIEHYQEAMKLAYSPEMGFYKIGRSYYMMGDMPAAIEYYKKAIALNKNRAQAHFDLASAYLKDGQTQNAIDELEITVKIDPGYPRAQEFLQKLKENAYP